MANMFEGDLFKAFEDEDEQEINQETTEQEEIEQEEEEQEEVEQEEVEQEERQEKSKTPKKKEEVKWEKAKDNKKGKKKDIDNKSETTKKDTVLYIIADKKLDDMVNYFRERGIKVSKVFSDIGEAKTAVLMQTEPMRIVVIDTGLGRFTTTAMREELIDMMGISDEQSNTTVFYTDSVLKVDTIRALGKVGKSIDWIPYTSTSVVAATIAMYKENYIYDFDKDDDYEYPSANIILGYKGLELPEKEEKRLQVNGLTSKAIMDNMINSEEGALEGYKIKM